MTTNPAASDDSISAAAIEAVAERLYGEHAYEALGEGQVKDAYRARARGLLQVARDATSNGG